MTDNLPTPDDAGQHSGAVAASPAADDSASCPEGASHPEARTPDDATGSESDGAEPEGDGEPVAEPADEAEPVEAGDDAQAEPEPAEDEPAESEPEGESDEGGSDAAEADGQDAAGGEPEGEPDADESVAAGSEPADEAEPVGEGPVGDEPAEPRPEVDGEPVAAAADADEPADGDEPQDESDADASDEAESDEGGSDAAEADGQDAAGGEPESEPDADESVAAGSEPADEAEPVGDAGEQTEPVDAEPADSSDESVVPLPIASASTAPTAESPAEAPTDTPANASSDSDVAAGQEAAAAVSASESMRARVRAAFTTAVRGRNRALLAGAAAVGLLVLAWGGAAIATTQHIFAGTTVSGVDVGGMSPDEARAAVADRIGAELAEPVTLTVQDATDSLVPADSGVCVDSAASIDRLTGPTLNPVTIVERLRGTDVGAVVSVDPRGLTIALNARLGTLARGTADAIVSLDGTNITTIPAINGTGLDVDASVAALTGDWPLGQRSIALVEGVAEPAITDADARSFVDSVLTPLLSADITITAAGTQAEATAAGAQLTLTPDKLASLTTISTTDGELSAVLDSQRLHDDLISTMGPIETPAVDAGWTIDGSAAGAAGARPQFVSPAAGNGIDMAALTERILDVGARGRAGGSGERTVAVPMTTLQPANEKPESEWGITEVIGEFSTPFTSQVGRDQNLIRGAEQMNGRVVMPGQTFSVEEALGPVDYDHGFADAGVVSNGQHVDALGGGLSQIGTTMFNVGFEAGMDDVEHHPHSYYFSRYPAGREATIWTGQKDVKFTNSTPYAVLIQAWVADDQVHARIWSTRYYDVSITSSERYNYRPVQTLTRPAGAGCEDYYGGNAGFDIDVTRTRKAPDKDVPDDVLTTSYDADNNIECVASAAR